VGLDPADCVASVVWRVVHRCLPVAARLRWRVALLDCGGTDSGAREWQRLLFDTAVSDQAWRRPIVSILYAQVYRNGLVFQSQAERNVVTLMSGPTLLALLPCALDGTPCATALRGSSLHVASFEDISLLVASLFSWKAEGAQVDAEWLSEAGRALAQELVLMIPFGGGLPQHLAAALDFASFV
jgi:hypothetical protein